MVKQLCIIGVWLESTYLIPEYLLYFDFLLNYWYCHLLCF